MAAVFFSFSPGILHPRMGDDISPRPDRLESQIPAILTCSSAIHTT